MARRLDFEERARIEAMRTQGVGVAEIAVRLGRDPSTIHRELGRGGAAGGYEAATAQAAAEARARRPRVPKLAADAVLAAAVCEGLRARRSPHALAAELRAEGLGVCAETVYAACYDHSGSRGLPEGSWRLLPRCRRRRRPRRRRTRKPSPLGDFKPIADRPGCVEDRREPGHWEGDLIIGAGNRSAVATLTERTSRMTLTVALPDGYDAAGTAEAVTAALGRQPEHLVRTVTSTGGCDRSAMMAGRQVSIRTGGGSEYGTACQLRRARPRRGDVHRGRRGRGDSPAAGQAPLDGVPRARPRRRPLRL